jgi:hypothetical protein
MGLHGPERDVQALADLGIGQSFDDEVSDHALGRSEAQPAGPRPLPCSAATAIDADGAQGGLGAGGGTSTAAMTQRWLSVLPGQYYAIAVGTRLTALAVSATVALGLWPAGLGLDAATMMVLGTPCPARRPRPRCCQGPRGQVVQWLPPGAGSTLLCSIGYFDRARSGGSWSVLAIWAVAGLRTLPDVKDHQLAPLVS